MKTPTKLPKRLMNVPPNRIQMGRGSALIAAVRPRRWVLISQRKPENPGCALTAVNRVRPRYASSLRAKRLVEEMERVPRRHLCRFRVVCVLEPDREPP